METLTQAIKLTVETAKPTGGGLAETIQQLDRIDAIVQKLHAHMNGLGVAPGAVRSVKELEGSIKALQAKGGLGLTPGDLSKGLGLEVAQFEKFVARYKKSLDYVNQQFRSAPAAARAVAQYERQAASGRRAVLGSLLTPATGSVSALKVEGSVALAIPAAQVQASVVGPITLAIPGGQITAGGLPRDPATGRILPGGGGGGGGGKRGGGKGALSVPGQAGEFLRVRTETEDALREVVTQANAMGELIATTHDSVEGIIKTVTRSRTGNAPVDIYRAKRRLEEEAFKASKAAVGGDFLGLATLQEKQASQLKALLTKDLADTLGPKKAAQVQELLTAQSTTLEAQAAASRASHAAQLKAAAERELVQKQREARAEVELERELAAKAVRVGRTNLQRTYSDTYRTGRGGFFTEMSKLEEERALRLTRALNNPLVGKRQMQSVGADIAQARANAAMFASMGMLPPKYSGATPPVIKDLAPTGETARFMSGLKAFTPMGFLANITKVTGWAAAVTVLYKSVEFATHSLERFMEIGAETAKLDQVFRGVGGSAQELAHDVMGLASQTGRSTDEAMESAREWSRLGLSRSQVGAATRVSLMAANVAPGLTTKESTEHLSSLMHIYGLEVRDLNGVLGMLVSTSQRYNVTVEQLFQGLDRAAGVAKQAGMSLAELQGILGATVGKTGQSGIVVGNTIKSILVQFSNPSIQKFLRGAPFGIETTRGGEQRSGSDILGDLFVRYQGLNDTQRGNLTRTVAGRLQGGRFIGMMESYVEGQKLAIESQLHLNSAEEAQVKILGTVRAQLAGVRAEFDKLIVSQANMKGPSGQSFNQNLVDIARGGKNALRIANRMGIPVLDMVTGGFMGTAAQLGRGISNLAETPFEKGQEAFANRVQEHERAASGYAGRAKMLERMSRALEEASSPGRRAILAESVVSELGPRADEFKAMVASGNLRGAQGLLRTFAGTAQDRSMKELGIAGTEHQMRIVEATAEKDRLLEELKTTKDLVGTNERLKVVKEELANLSQNKTTVSEAMIEENAQTEAENSRRQEYITLLKEQELVMREIANLSSQETMGTAGAKLDAEVRGLTQQIGEMERAHAALLAHDGADVAGTANELRQQITETTGRRDALNSPRMRALTDLYDNRRIASQRASEEAGSYGVGYGEGDKLLNERSALLKQLGRINPNTASDNDAVRGKQLEIELWHTQERIQTRIVDLARQEKQIRLDATREFQRALLMAGPGEQLQRLHVAQMMRRPGGVGAGEFLAMSPELRRQYFEATGGEAGAMNRYEQRRLRGEGLTVAQEQAGAQGARGWVGRWDAQLGRHAASVMAGMPPTTPMPAVTALETNARNAALSLGTLAGTAARVNQELLILGQRVRSLAVPATPVPNTHGATVRDFSQPQLGLSPGYSLGNGQ